MSSENGKNTMDLVFQNVDIVLSKVEYSVACIAKENGISSEMEIYEKVIYFFIFYNFFNIFFYFFRKKNLIKEVI